MVQLDVSSNGFDYDGGFEFIFTNTLEVYRIKPLCGPNEGGTSVNLIGTGFKANEAVQVKWGIVKAEVMPVDQVKNFVDTATYSEDL